LSTWAKVGTARSTISKENSILFIVTLFNCI